MKGTKILKNFLSLLIVFFTCVNARAEPLPEVDFQIEYNSPGEALSALRLKPGVEISVQGGWTIAYDPALHVTWSFAPEKHASYPSVVKRAVVAKDGTVFVNMDVKCKASKDICDELVREFLQLNEQMRLSIQSGAGSAK